MTVLHAGREYVRLPRWDKHCHAPPIRKPVRLSSNVMTSVADRLLAESRERLDAACIRHGVERLELFGSAASGEFREAESDLDFLVEFQAYPYSEGDLFSRYFGLKEDLEKVFGHQVDLVMVNALNNPYMIESVNKARLVVFPVRVGARKPSRTFATPVSSL